jgi:hypothetical protein
MKDKDSGQKEESELIYIDTADYSLNSVMKAAYTLLDISNIIIDGDPETELVLEIIPKDNTPAEQIKQTFFLSLEKFNKTEKYRKELQSFSDELMHQAHIENERKKYWGVNWL